ncbi:MAG: trypsin-like peptidase domain-containing protein [Bacteroidales bacterium]|nr:trypsin-like peptidase domain-containing protein [Clostridium sp.]MCM1202880.1 trypsin-like peptidase domain-containing protein [Bacteroidales bacterium]
MENENSSSQQTDSTYHYGRNESPFGREDISGRTTEASYTESAADEQQAAPSGNPYSQGNVYGQGIYMGNDFAAQQPPKKEKKRKEKKSSGGKAKKLGALIASAAVFGLVAGGVMVGVNAIGGKVLEKNKTTEIATVAAGDAGMTEAAKDTTGIADVAEEVMPSLVSITNTSVQTVRSWFQSYEQEVSGSGSGIIIGQDDDEIMIVTNNHVIEGESVKELTVAFNDKTAVAATVKGADSAADLAVLTVKTKDLSADTLSKIKVAALGSSDDLRIGDRVIAIGNALGYGQSLTGGYVSALERQVDLEDKSMTLLQTDAAINPGNSGGALLNTKGEVVGINTVKYVDSTVEGMGYAIPISTAIPIINDLMNQQVIKESEQGYLGIQGNDVTDDYAQSFNMPTGVYVVKIIEGSPADESGLKAGDIITKVGERTVSSMEGLQNILSGKKAGEEVKLTVQRNSAKGEYEEVVITVKLGAKKDMPESSSEEKNGRTEEDTEEGEFFDSPQEFFDDFNEFMMP